ncbi:UNVERIFIED_CONTAM: hypothetical protein GTU68_015881, partial [Idotea baltica]|nr:hypothetical protein [Idotea baltica]
LLNIKNLSVKFPTRFGEFTALDSIELQVNAGEIHGLVGESGAGKSTVGSAIMGLLQSPGYVSGGEIEFMGSNLLQLNEDDYHKLRGQRISMIFQDPQTSLNPLLTIAAQLIETIRQHSDVSHADARARAINLLQETGLQDVDGRMDEYPHQFSGGMRQRVVIALALCTDPELIIADEPTTALDVSVQKQILELIRTLCTKRNIGIILITHDIGVINEITDRVTVLRSGRVIETGTTSSVLGQPTDEYTKALMAAAKRETAAQSSTDENVILSVSNLSVTFHSGQPGWFGKKEGFKALSEINFSMRAGEVLGVVGESGSGKSTLAKAIVGLVDPSGGSMRFRGKDLPPGSQRERSHPVRREIQMVFQDPYSSLNNRRTVEDIIAEPIRFYDLATNSQEIRRLVASVLDLVEMPQRAMLKYPHQFSGGQRQRIAVARALVAQPDFLICDEPTSALDVSIQAQMLNLLKDLQQAFGLSILFISHNLAVIRQMADSVVVLRNGQLVEAAETEQFFNEPTEPYSQMLLSETPSLSLLDSTA